VDVLADVLSVTRLGATVIAQAELVAPWGLEIDPLAEAHVHVVQRGSCWLRTSDSRRHVALGAGDVVLIRGGIGHSICDHPKTRPAPHKTVLEGMKRRLAALPKARANQTTVVLCAKYLFQHVGPHPLTALLPPLIHLRAEQAGRHVELQLLLQLLRQEAIEPGSGTGLVIPRLLDSLLVFVVRAWLEGQPVGAGGWFGALRDPAIARALSLIHERPEAPWSVTSLAKAIALSRATFARRFAGLVGESPLSYVSRWRMCLAAKLLAESDATLEEIATRVGYQTASAFSKAFRRNHGRTPGSLRVRPRVRRQARRHGKAKVRRTDKK
jgi:AraC-like DNA-binding protein